MTKSSNRSLRAFGADRTRVRRAVEIQQFSGIALVLQRSYSQMANYMRLNNILPPTALPRPGRGGGSGGD